MSRKNRGYPSIRVSMHKIVLLPEDAIGFILWASRLPDCGDPDRGKAIAILRQMRTGFLSGAIKGTELTGLLREQTGDVAHMRLMRRWLSLDDALTWCPETPNRFFSLNELVRMDERERVY